ncbi:phosphatidylinositol/phosphatidylglycerol transfer protein [Hypoxylon fragiforme]|uniref:phosphatidylinositol/phosphatidylglycerol transfer protein n=1 Tax=Hypoxylon fragiforme TaxID=63214 RepID=UPI0020C6E591|nr:phosphatidylinositol/phosphatidylglycerol transfer protein [Hypoxylon fragiforme]KAI2607304.1 phosphatidylinositol/phosphatidylglycerol transfer protein [Hypoxylon fragiforme]
MRFSTACVAALSASVASAGSWFGGSEEVVVKDVQKVPGDSPLEFCDSDHSKDIVHIENVDLSPNPPESGAELVIQATGTVFEPITEGAYVNLVVKYGLIRLISTKADLCEQIQNVDLKCPIEKGDLSITKSVEIPKEVPPGTYTVFAEVISADERPITCLQATVKFGGSKATLSDDL